MTLEHLENLVRINQLKSEQPDQQEFNGLVRSARNRLSDARLEGLSVDGKFLSAYGAAHALATAALRWHGYRSENRYLVFQCLQHTVGLDKVKWLVLDQCHKKRNIAEYEGQLEVSSQLLEELIGITSELLPLVEKLGPINT
ncbi:MAG: hypothetical protein OQL16_00365 [Gammaproteobacteria bacterium]|nr:hypothetical protein [Gammaproteobacteria bacterium]